MVRLAPEGWKHDHQPQPSVHLGTPEQPAPKLSVSAKQSRAAWGVRVVGEAGDGRQALRLVEQHKAHLLILDIAMTGMNGLDAAEAMRRRHPVCHVLVLSMHENSGYMAGRRRDGARGGPEDGGARGALRLSGNGAACRRSGPPGLGSLTLPQRETLQLIGGGRTAKTADTHRTRLMERLGIHDIAGLVRFAIRSGLVSPKR